jgi:hypothetical protein
MTTKEAETNLLQLLDVAVQRGIMGNSESVINARASITFLVQTGESAGKAAYQLQERITALEKQLRGGTGMPGMEE